MPDDYLNDRVGIAKTASARSSPAKWPRPSWSKSNAVSPTPSSRRSSPHYKKFYAHDEKSEAKPGDRVRIEETRPLSKTKRWRLVEVVSAKTVGPRGRLIMSIMLQIRSILDVADNTGAKRAAAIGVLGRNQRYARVGDVIKAHIKEAAPDGTVKKGEVVNAVVVRTRQPIRRSDGSYLRFDSNAIVIIDAKIIRRARASSGRWRANCATRSS